MNILCIIYGIGRGINSSAPSINNEILKPLEKLNLNIETIYILNKIDFIENKRSMEFGEIKNVPENIFLNEERFLFSHDQLLDNKILSEVKKVKDIHNDDYKSYENLLCQLAMLKEAHNKKDFLLFDRILMIRDDLLVKNSHLDFLSLIHASRYGPITSMWHWHGGIGERFVFCMPLIGIKLACRIDEVLNFISEKGYLNGEHLQKYIIDKEDEKIMAINLKLIRVRLNFMVDENFLLPFWRPKELLRVFFALFRYNYKKLIFSFSNKLNQRR